MNKTLFLVVVLLLISGCGNPDIVVVDEDYFIINGTNVSISNATIDIINFGNKSAMPNRTLIYGYSTSTGTPQLDGFRIYYTQNFGAPNNDYLVFQKTDGNDAYPDGGIAFSNLNASNKEIKSMVIKGNGNVGIGTTSPITKLQINGNMNVSKLIICNNGTASIMTRNKTLAVTMGCSM